MSDNMSQQSQDERALLRGGSVAGANAESSEQPFLRWS
jgi:hypothetical protein